MVVSDACVLNVVKSHSDQQYGSGESLADDSGCDANTAARKRALVWMGSRFGVRLARILSGKMGAAR